MSIARTARRMHANFCILNESVFDAQVTMNGVDGWKVKRREVKET
jgi:hypothetical protein